jgi:hypothetical protein
MANTRGTCTVKCEYEVTNSTQDIRTEKTTKKRRKPEPSLEKCWCLIYIQGSTKEKKSIPPCKVPFIVNQL